MSETTSLPPAGGAPLRIAYVLKRFPRLSETFVLNELLELERQGVEVEIYSLLKPPPEARHALLGELKAQVRYLPSTGACNGLKLRAGDDAETVRLGDTLPFDGIGDFAGDPIFAAKTPEEVATLHIKAATLALALRLRGLKHMHAHFGSDATTVALLAARMTGVGYSYTAHARDIYHLYASPAADAAMRRAKICESAFVATVSEYNRRHLAQIAPGAADRIHRVYNGVDLTRLVPAKGERRPGEILAVGRMIEKKGFSDLIEACALLAAEGTPFRCRIIGDGPLRPALEAQAAQLGLEDRVEMPGALPHEAVLAEMREASVLAAPFVIADSGDRDGLPTVLLEALALSTPAVTTSVTGAPEIVEDGVTGRIVTPGAPREFADALRSVLADPKTAAEMGRQARRRAEDRFDLRTNVGLLHHLIRGAVRGDGASSEAAA